MDIQNTAGEGPVLQAVVLGQTDQSLASKVYSDELNEEASTYYKKGLEGASNTQKAYKSDLKQFQVWCEQMKYLPCPLATGALVQYITHLGRTLSYFSIQRHLASIAKYHRLNKVLSPTTDEQFKIFIKGLKVIKTVKQKQAPDFSLRAFRQAVDAQGDTPTGIRNKVILLLGFSGAFRRGELVALNLENLEIDAEGMVIRMDRSKTNQAGEIEEKSVDYAHEAEYCPILTVQKWQGLLGRSEGPLLVRIRKGEQLTDDRLSDLWVNRMVKKSLGENFTAHSLRASFVTIAKANGADDKEVMNQTKHKTTSMIQRYDRRNNIRKVNGSKKLGL